MESRYAFEHAGSFLLEIKGDVGDVEIPGNRWLATERAEISNLPLSQFKVAPAPRYPPISNVSLLSPPW
jgi:hypothetical protein